MNLTGINVSSCTQIQRPSCTGMQSGESCRDAVGESGLSTSICEKSGGLCTGADSGQCEVAAKKQPRQALVALPEAPWTSLKGQTPFCQMKWGMRPKTHITEKSRHRSWRSSREACGGFQPLPLAFARDTIVTAPSLSFLICETSKLQVGRGMVAGERQEPSSSLAGLTPPPFSPSSLCVGGSHWRTACRKAVGGRWSLSIFGGLDQDYMCGFSRVELHASFLQLNPINRSERSVTFLVHVQTRPVSFSRAGFCPYLICTKLGFWSSATKSAPA